jgi:hypothetical protein
MSAVVLAVAMFFGTTSQVAFERCGETHLTVANDTTETVWVKMFGRYARLEPGEFTVFWTNEPVEVDRVTRKRAGQVYHTSITSVFVIERRPCTFEWATL